MKTIREYFAAHYFMRMTNGKFLVIEGAFIYMIIACAILTYGVLEFYSQWALIPFLLPFLFGVYLFIFAPKIDFIDDLAPHWHTQLKLLKDPKMSHVFDTRYDKDVENRLSQKWIETYGEDYEDLEFVKLQKWHAIALPVICLIIFMIWEIL